LIGTKAGGWLSYVTRITLLAAIYVLVGRIGFMVSAVDPIVSSVWPPSGVALAALLLMGTRFWPGVFLGAFILNLTGTIAPLAAMTIAVGNTGEALVAARLLKSVGFRPSLERLRDVLALVVLGAIASTPVSATVGVTVLAFVRGTFALPGWTIWATWFSGDALGIVLVTPLILIWVAGPPPRVSRRDVIEATVLSALLIACAVALWRAPVSYVYAIFPLTIWAALRFGVRGAAAASLVVTAIAVGFRQRRRALRDLHGR
jgi:integral membrane sensor domain MASE1